MNTRDTFFLGWAFGIVLSLIIDLTMSHEAESKCQTKHNVADCSWQRTPFLPVEETTDG